MSTAISELKTATALSPVENTAKAIAAAAQEEGANELGTLLKYSKGHYLIGAEEIPMGTQYIARVEHWVRGYVKFKGGCLVEHKVGRVADGFVVPTREELDETDQASWEKSPSGEPKDPWSKQSYLPLENIETGEIVTFVSGSYGDVRHVEALFAGCKAPRHDGHAGHQAGHSSPTSTRHTQDRQAGSSLVNRTSEGGAAPAYRLMLWRLHPVLTLMKVRGDEFFNRHLPPYRRFFNDRFSKLQDLSGGAAEVDSTCRCAAPAANHLIATKRFFGLE